jgi:Na+-transporting methylmalonyl-CoA/oxaloacetate decarboxylase gamma subunit
MIKIVVVFLMLLLIISMVGNLVAKFFAPPAPPKSQTRAKCANCGRSVLGTAPCVCGKG